MDTVFMLLRSTKWSAVTSWKLLLFTFISNSPFAF